MARRELDFWQIDPNSIDIANLQANNASFQIDSQENLYLHQNFSNDQTQSYENSKPYEQEQSNAQLMYDSGEITMDQLMFGVPNEEITNQELDDVLFPELHADNIDLLPQTVSNTTSQPTITNTQQPTITKTQQPSMPSLITNFSDSPLEVSVFHKPRGSKGIWQRVEASSALRVTKGKGKWLKLELRSLAELHASSVSIYLIEPSSRDSLPKEEDKVTENTIMNESSSNGIFVIEIELKLDKVAKRIQYVAVAQTNIGTITGKSVEFAAHNNGKAGNKREKEDEAVHSTSPVVTSDSSPHSMSPERNNQATVMPIQGNIIPLQNEVDQNSNASPLNIHSIPESFVSQPPIQIPPSTPQNKKRRTTETENSNSIEMIPLGGSPRVINGSLRVHGVVRAHGFIQYSDLRLKTNISEITDAINIIGQLSGKTYSWKPEELSSAVGGRRVIGLIAQEVRKVVPEVVYEDKQTGLLSVSYVELVPVLIEAFKELMTLYEADKQNVQIQVIELKEKLSKLARDLAQLEESNIQLIEKQAKQRRKQPPGENSNEFVGKFVNKGETIKRGFLRTAVIFSFLIGIISLILGSIIFGTTLSGPLSSLQVNIVDASGLPVAFDSGGTPPDPYVEVEVRGDISRSEIKWNTPEPRWNQVFEFDFEYHLDISDEIKFTVYDAPPDISSESPRRLGIAHTQLNQFKKGVEKGDILTLESFSDGYSVQGSLYCKILYKEHQKGDFEIALICVGVIFLAFSLAIGILSWRSKEQSHKSM